jgi:hypothetical protein
MITPILVFALITVLPIKWASDFTDGNNTGLIACVIASLIAPALAVTVYRLSSGGFVGVVFAYVAMVAVYVAVLRIPARSMIGFSVVVLALQGAAIAALVSFGGGRLALSLAI